MNTWRPLTGPTTPIALVGALALVAGLSAAGSRLTGASAPPSAPASPTAPHPGFDVARSARSARADRAGVVGWSAPGGSPSPAAAPGPPATASAPRWSCPLSPRPLVVRPFSAPPGPYAAGHRGVDLAAAAGDVVRSPTAGTVTFAGAVAGRHVLVVTHRDGLRSTLEPVTASVAVGATVDRGQAVGAVDDGPGHCAPATCLHWGVLRGATYLDPLRLVDTPRVVLLPLGP